MKNIIVFAGKAYAQAPSPMQGVRTDGTNNFIDTMSAAELQPLYNLVAANLGQGRVKRFADNASARRRTWAKLVEWDSQEDGATLMVMPPIKVAAKFNEKLAEKSPEVPQEKPEVAAGPVTTPPPAHVQAAGRWQRPKHEAPCRVAYRPKPNTVQQFMYDMLTRQPNGVNIHDFCAEMKAAGHKDKSWLAPAGVWTGLRYIFVTLRGYGLNFDGTMLQLLMPTGEERAHDANGKA